METDAELAGILPGCDRVPGVRLLPVLNDYVGDMSDHHVFRVNRRPYLFLSCGQWEHYHLPTDTPEPLEGIFLPILHNGEAG